MEGRITDAQAAWLKRRGVAVNFNMSKQEASNLIDEIIKKPIANGKIVKEPQTEFSKPFEGRRNYGSQGPMWGRYAVDLLIAMLNIQKDSFIAGKVALKELIDTTALATNAIQIVLSMRNQFKE